MPASALLRDRLEAALAHKIPGALSPKPRILREFVSTGIRNVDELLHGGFPANAITEIVGAECSGRTSLALSFIAGLTQAGKVCAWIDASDALHPESAAATGVDLQRLLWVRCGVASGAKDSPSDPRAFVSEFSSARNSTVPEKYFVPRPAKKGLHGGGFGSHPRGEVKGLSNAIADLFKEKSGTSSAGLPRITKPDRESQECNAVMQFSPNKNAHMSRKPWSRLDRALRATDLLLQNGGFAAIVLDMGSIAPAHALRVPLATWFRYRAVAEQKQTSVILLLQHPCAKSSAVLTLRLHAGNPRSEPTIFAGIDFFVEVERQRCLADSEDEDIAALRKPPQTQRWAQLQSRTAWAGR
jgi:recombination protein RecA